MISYPRDLYVRILKQKVSGLLRVVKVAADREERMEQNGLQVLVPGFDEQQRVHEIIVQELVRGRIEEASRITYLRVIEGLIRAGAEGIVLGCTEIPLLIRQEDSAAPLLDTAAIHADAALEYALGEA
ncbi:MAG: aspartate/glutamate racemase family protein [Desulfohalobiaceae bacterium]|nr:aspartate/glutamate racemase family protein [Desulfohalobiaceae bacterium]